MFFCLFQIGFQTKWTFIFWCVPGGKVIVQTCLWMWHFAASAHASGAAHTVGTGPHWSLGIREQHRQQQMGVLDGDATLTPSNGALPPTPPPRCVQPRGTYYAHCQLRCVGVFLSSFPPKGVKIKGAGCGGRSLNTELVAFGISITSWRSCFPSAWRPSLYSFLITSPHWAFLSSHQ